MYFLQLYYNTYLKGKKKKNFLPKAQIVTLQGVSSAEHLWKTML